MKKLCSIILLVSMLLGCLTVTGFAETTTEHIAIDANATTVTLENGNEYKVIRDKEQFLAMQTGNRYIFANDIDLGGMKMTSTYLFDLQWLEIDGNNYSILNYSAESGHQGMFYMYKSTSDAYTVTLRNLSFGSATAPIKLGSTTSNGGSAVVVPFIYCENSVLTCDNVKVYTDIDNVKHCVSGFVGRLQAGSITMNNCEVYGDITTTSGGKVGAFVGRKAAGTIALTGCTNYANITGTSNVGGLIGNDENSDAINLKNCMNKGTITTTASDGCGGLIGKSVGMVQIANCEHQGTVLIQGTAVCGDYIGVANCVMLSLVGKDKTEGFVGSLGATTKVVYEELFKDDTGVEEDAVTLPEEYTFTKQQIANDATTVEIGGVSYNVIRTADEFKAMKETANYILANDIDFGGTIFEQHLLTEEWDGILDGNGYRLSGFAFNCTASTDNGIFAIGANSNVTIRNLNIGSADALIDFQSVKKNTAGVIAGLIGGGSVVTVENTHVWASVQSIWESGGFFGRADAASNILINSCSMNGIINASKGKNGGLIGLSNASSVRIYNTVNNAKVCATNQNNAGFIGLANTANTSIEIISCIQRGDVVTSDATYGTAGFVGKSKASIALVNSRVEGNITVNAADDTAKPGKFIGIMDGSLIKMTLPLGMTSVEGLLGSVKDTTTQSLITLTAGTVSSVEDLKNMSGNGWYVLNADLTLTEAVEISGGNVTGATLDLNGKTLTGNLAVIDGILTVGNGTLAASNDTATITVKNDAGLVLDAIQISGKTGVSVMNDASVTMTEGVKISAVNYALVSDGTVDSNVRVNGAELTVTGGAQSDVALKWNSLGTLNITEGKISATGDGVALEFLKGDVLITGGELSGKYAMVWSGAENATLTVEDGTFNGTDAAVLEKTNAASITVLGGTFAGTANGAFGGTASGDKVEISGGKFDEEIPSAYLAEGYVSMKQGDGSYSVDYHEHNYENCQYEAINVGSHNKFCTICNEAVSEAHNWSDYKVDAEGKHYRVCTDCQREGSHQDHDAEVDATTGNTVCKTCGALISSADTTTTTPQETETTENTPATPEEKGCKSVVSGSMLIVLMICLTPLFVGEKRRKCE